MKRYFAVAGAALVLVISLSLGASGIASAQGTSSGSVDVPVTASGTATNAQTGQTQSVGLNGTFHLDHFTALNNQVYAVGTLDGTITDQSGNTLATVSAEPEDLTAQAINSSCNSLDVQVGPASVPMVQSNGDWTASLNSLDLGITNAHPANDFSQFALCTLANMTGGSVQLNSSNLPVSAGNLAQGLNNLLAAIS